MTTYDPDLHRDIVGANGESNRKFWPVNKFVILAAEAGLISLVKQDTEPGDTTKVWLDVDEPESSNGTVKVYSSGSWIPMTPALFAEHIGAGGGGGGGGTWGSITGTLSNQTDLQTALDALQPLDADLTAIAALTTAAAGRSTLELSDPNADRIAFWDDSAGKMDWLTAGSGLTITGTTIAATGGGTGDVTAASSIPDNEIVRGDGGSKGVQGSGITIDDTKNVSGVAALSATTIELGHASDTTLARSGAGDITIEGNAVYRAGGTDVPLADGGTGASLTDPNADRILFWDDSAGAVTWLEAGSGLSISGTTLTATGGNVSNTGTPVDNQIAVWTTATTVEGDSALTFDTTTDTLTVNGTNGNITTGTSGVITTGTIEIGSASDTTISRSSAGNIAVEGNVVYRAAGTDVALADGGTGASLTDPNADRILFWDDSAGAVTWLEAGSGLSISGTTLTATGGGDGWEWIYQNQNRNFATGTGWQTIFNDGTNSYGFLPEADTIYEFECQFTITSMSATSGNLKFGLSDGVNALSFHVHMFHVVGLDATTPTTAAAQGGSFHRGTGSTGQTVGNIVTAATGTAASVTIKGIFSVDTADDLIPVIQMTTSVGTAAISYGGAFFKLRKLLTDANVGAGANVYKTSGWATV